MEAPKGRRGFEVRTLPRSGYEGTLEGELVVRGGEVESLRMIADGEAWGESSFTEGAPKGRFPLKIAFVLAEPDDVTAREVAPYGVAFDEDGYLAVTLD